MVFNDVTCEHNVLIRHVDDDIARCARVPNALNRRDGSQDRQTLIHQMLSSAMSVLNAFVSFKQTWEALEFTVPIFLPRSTTMARAISDMMI